MILQVSLDLAHHNHPEFYRVAALQLRLLLCDTTRRHNHIVDISLAPQVIPGLALHPLNAYGNLDLNQKALPLHDWLEQSLSLGSKPPLTIRQLIRRVCDQDGGAHVDYKPHAGIINFEGFQTHILTIGEYVVSELFNKLQALQRCE